MEITLAIRLSREWTTEQIVDTLLAESVSGRCSFGIGQAAHTYCGRPLAQLQPQDTLALIARLKEPSAYDPGRNPERFRQRYDAVAEMLGQRDPGWLADIALARMMPPTCIGTHARSAAGHGHRATTGLVR